VVLCLTGTDLYGEHGAELLASMGEADRLVVLQKKALDLVPAEFREKTRLIVQGARRMFGWSGEKGFQVCVVGHLREVKDPLRTAKAARLLPPESQIEVVQVGAILEWEFGPLVEQEMVENSRYRWVGELSGLEGRKLIAQSRVLVLSSRMEGGARVVGEAAVEGTPILSSRIDGVVGLLGENYPGYFEVGDTEGLAQLLARVETDAGFLQELHASVTAIADQFDPARESAAWEGLMAEIDLL
jgi:glycosyltransferase involved in cell wall biosynthesis